MRGFFVHSSHKSHIRRLIVAAALALTSSTSASAVTPRPAFLDAPDRITLPMSTATESSTLAGRVDVHCGDADIPVTGIGSTADPRVLEVGLAKPIGPADIDKAITIDIDNDHRIVCPREVLSTPDYYYDGDDLGPTYAKRATTFKVWSPPSSTAAILLYKNTTGPSYITIPMRRGEHGVWYAQVKGDLDGVFYQYDLHCEDRVLTTPDIYAKAASKDLRRSMVVDLARTGPKQWTADRSPRLPHPTDAIIYELHIADFTSDPASGVDARVRGRYLGMVQTGTKIAGSRVPSGLDYLKWLGITHVQILPFQSINHTHTANSIAPSLEGRPGEESNYNWGYETDLFNVPEPRYAVDADNPAGVVSEVKSMVAGFHRAGIGVVMDVVYNHSNPPAGDQSAFDATVPYYYMRTNPDGSLRNESACGNAIDDEHPMVRKFIRDSLLYWMREYHIDGFRFDLMGMFTPETMRDLSTALHKVRPDVLMYGEPWTGGGPTRFGKGAQKGLGIGVFNDEFRWTMRGDTNGPKPGFALGGGADAHELENVISGTPSFTSTPAESMNYVSIHDDLTYLDKTALVFHDDAQQWRALEFAAAIVMCSQGIPVLEGGVELGRTKGGNSNSFVDAAANRFDWKRGAAYSDLADSYRYFIHLRRSVPGLRCSTADEVRRTLKFLPSLLLLVEFELVGDKGAPNEIVIFNGSTEAATFTLPAGDWMSRRPGRRLLRHRSVDVGPLMGTVFGRFTLP